LIPGQLYFAVIIGDTYNNKNVYRCLPDENVSPILGCSSSMLNPNLLYRVSNAYGALPDPFPAYTAGDLKTAGPVPAIALYYTS